MTNKISFPPVITMFWRNYHIIQCLSSIRRGRFDKRIASLIVISRWRSHPSRPCDSGIVPRTDSPRQPIRSTSLPFPSGSEDTMKGNRTFARRAYWVSRGDVIHELFQRICVILNEEKKREITFVDFVIHFLSRCIKKEEITCVQ